MSYTEITPAYYEMSYPQTPWHSGAPGWSSAPFVGWGQNPNRSGPPRLAVDGLGCGCSARGVGDEAAPGFPWKPVLTGAAVVAGLAFLAMKR